MNSELQALKDFVDENRFLDESYFLILSIVLAFGILQTAGAGLGTEKPVVTVISTSMCPALQVGDILVVQSEDYSEIQEDDIIVYDVPDRAEFTVNGESYTLEASEEQPSETVETGIGTVQLVDVRPSTTDRSRDSAIFRINGSIPESGGDDSVLVEGNSYEFAGGSIEIDYLTDLPYGNVPIVHRVIEKSDDHVETMGDNNRGQLEFEDSVRPDQIHGTVAVEIPRLGLVKILLMDFMGYSGDQPFVIDNTPSCGSA
ncbi:hypothetical protein ACK3SF_01700 [Candidatus Nanosalina sp. VS9-1]|uniref:hypothetical protein n=1 Tax=Candidatus Nanosalina sp. VS9-1 TaxID=3388566 RepID=UPI0039DF4F0B